MKLLLALLLLVGMTGEDDRDGAHSNMTPNIQVVHDYVKANYGLQAGVTNCRKISGSVSWSQHSWSNANDFYTSDKALQDRIAADLKAEYGSHIRNVLTWRYNAAHWNHIHVDMWPKGLYTPPCAGGALRVKHKDGSRGTVFTSDLDPYDGGNIMANMQVIDIQKALNLAGVVDYEGKKLVEDGDYGPRTESALVKAYEPTGAFELEEHTHGQLPYTGGVR